MKRLFKSIGCLACLLLFTWGGYTSWLYYLSRPYITIVGSACVADGIGRQSVELLAELQAKVTVDFIPTTKTCLKDIPKHIQKKLRNRYKKLGRIILFEDCIWVPGKPHYQLLKNINRQNHICLAYSMFESTEIPKDWVDGLNNYFDAVIVPDPFHVEIYKQNGL